MESQWSKSLNNWISKSSSQNRMGRVRGKVIVHFKIAWRNFWVLEKRERRHPKRLEYKCMNQINSLQVVVRDCLIILRLQLFAMLVVKPLMLCQHHRSTSRVSESRGHGFWEKSVALFTKIAGFQAGHFGLRHRGLAFASASCTFHASHAWRAGSCLVPERTACFVFCAAWDAFSPLPGHMVHGSSRAVESLTSE